MRALICLALVGCTADLRPEKSPADAANRGHALMRALGQTYGIDTWRHRRTVELVFRDDWESALASFIGLEPWDAEDTIRFRLRAGSFDVRADFVAGPRRGEAIGVIGGRTWARAPEGGVAWQEDGDVRFILSAIAFLAELPFRLQTADVVEDAGDELIAGQRYERLLVTWGSVEASADVDQYLLYIHPDTRHIVWADFTVRETARFYTSRAHYADLRRVDGVLMPFRIVIGDRGDGIEDGFVHEVSVQSAAFDGFEVDALQP